MYTRNLCIFIIICGDRLVNSATGERKGHCWLVDGYAKIGYSYVAHETYVVDYLDDWTGRTSTVLEEYDKTGKEYSYYQHFNLGWDIDGPENINTRGYYLESIFDVKDEYKINSNSEPTRYYNDFGNRNYKYSVKISTNIHP